MKVGSLVRRTRHSHHKLGVILRASNCRFRNDQRPDFWVHWFDLDPSEERHGWCHTGELEVVA